MKFLLVSIVLMFLYHEGHATVTTICDSTSKTLSCAGGQVLAIYEAWYGRQNLVDCPVSSGSTSCIQDITSNIRSLCAGKSSCIIQANNAFGDPCVGTNKYFSIDYNCVVYTNIQLLIDNAIKSNQAQINLSPGVYVTKSFQISNVKTSLKINGNGATLMFDATDTTNFYDIFLVDSTNVTITNLFIDHSPLPFTQGKVTYVDPQGDFFEMAVDTNYPKHTFRFRDAAAHVFDPTKRTFKEEGSIFQTGIVEPTPSQGLRVRSSAGSGQQALVSNVQVNDLVVVMSPRKVHAIYQVNGRNTLMKNVTIYSSSGIGLVEFGGGGNVYDQVYMMRGPSPTATSQPRLMSLAADGFHLSGPSPGSVIINSIVEFNGDDGINIRTGFPKVTSVQGNFVFVDITYYNLDVNDPVYIYDGTTFALKGIVTATQVGYLDQNNIFQLNRITLSSTANVKAGDGLISYQHAQQFKIQNNIFQYNDARGIVASGRNILVQNNQVTGTTMGGIWIGAEFTGFNEGPFPDTVIVSDNTLLNICYTRRGRSSIFFGAISVMTDTDPATLARWNATKVNRNIVIMNNSIAWTALVGIYLSQVMNASVCYNQLSNTNRKQSLDGFDIGWGVDSSYSLPIKDSKQVTLYRNWISSYRPIKLIGSEQINLNSLYNPCGYKPISNNNFNLKQLLKAHTLNVLGLTILPGDQVATSSQDSTVKVWDLKLGQQVTSISFTAPITSVAYLPTRALATSSGDKSIKIWATANWKQNGNLVGHTDEIKSLTVLSNGTLVSTSLDGTIKTWNHLLRSMLKSITTTSAITSTLLLPNDFIATGHRDAKVRIVNLDTSAVLFTLTGHMNTVNALTLLSNGNLVSGGDDSKVFVWSAINFSLVKTLGPFTSTVRSLASHTNGGLAVGLDNSQILIINSIDWTTRQTILTQGGSVSTMSLLSNGDLVSGSADGNLRIYSRN